MSDQVEDVEVLQREAEQLKSKLLAERSKVSDKSCKCCLALIQLNLIVSSHMVHCPRS